MYGYLDALEKPAKKDEVHCYQLSAFYSQLECRHMGTSSYSTFAVLNHFQIWKCLAFGNASDGMDKIVFHYILTDSSMVFNFGIVLHDDHQVADVHHDKISNDLLIILTSKAAGTETFKVVCNALSVEATCQCSFKIKENLLGNEGQVGMMFCDAVVWKQTNSQISGLREGND
ncbi:Glutamate Receptor 2 [Manis pentadactyla]|nr:Glutamate Receptor 2 [Manis pentadactyla]